MHFAFGTTDEISHCQLLKLYRCSLFSISGIFGERPCLLLPEISFGRCLGSAKYYHYFIPCYTLKHSWIQQNCCSISDEASENIKWINWRVRCISQVLCQVFPRFFSISIYVWCSSTATLRSALLSYSGEVSWSQLALESLLLFSSVSVSVLVVGWIFCWILRQHLRTGWYIHSSSNHCHQWG